MPGKPQVDARRERDNLKQKQRLRYLLDKYSPSDLRGVEFYRRLRLHPRGQIHKDPKGGTPLPPAIAARLPNMSEKDFSYLLETDVSKRAAGRYLPGQGLNNNLCDAIAWVIVDAYKFWPDGALADADVAAQKRQQISDFISNGTSQPARVFFGIENRQAEEITYASRGEEASAHRQKSFLRGDIRPAFDIVNSDATVERDCEDRLYKNICEGSPSVTLLTSAAGDGKSTLLYRLAQRMFDAGWRVLIKHEALFDTEPSWPLGQDERTNTVVFIDRAENLRGLQSLYLWAAENPNLRVVLAAREIDWVQHGHPLLSPQQRHMPLPRLTNREIDNLAALLLAHSVSEPPASLDDLTKRLRHSVRETEYPHMLAAVMTACRGAQFSAILISMIEKFPQPDLLKWTTLCAAGTDPHNNPTYATHRLMSALFCSSNAEPIEDGSKRFSSAHRQVSSEIITIHGSRYDLRHPDITKFVLRHLYDADQDGSLRKVVELEDDLFRIMRAVLRVRLREDRRIRQGIPDSYIYDIPRSWWSSKYGPDHGIGRPLYEDVYEQLGNLNADRRLRANLLRGWLRSERTVEPADPTSIEVQRKWLPKLTATLLEAIAAAGDLQQEEQLNAELYKAYQTHFEFAIRRNELGTFADPECDTARFLLRQMWNWSDGKFRGPKLLQQWQAVETTIEGLGNLKDPLPYTVRWLFQSLWKDRSHLSPTLMVLWTQVESKLNPPNIGSTNNPADYTARWICREAWKAESLRNVATVLHWTQMEIDARPSNIGDKEEPDEYSARWILRAAWNKEDLRSAELALRWAEIETDVKPSNLGNKDEPHQHSARWIFREAWKAESTRSAEMALRWAQIENDAKPSNLGDKDKPDQYSARWIFREAWKAESTRSAQMALRWAQIENDANPSNLGNKDEPSQYCARWIFRDAWKAESTRSAEMALQWAQIETSAKPSNIGNRDVPDEYSARWILREAWGDRDSLTPSLVTEWAQIEVGASPPNIGERDKPAEYTARWVFREAWKVENLRSSEVAIRWAQIETDTKPSNIGHEDDPDEYSARWILRKVWGSPDSFNPTLAIEWAQIEIGANPSNIGDKDKPKRYSARWIFREAYARDHRKLVSNRNFMSGWAHLEIRQKNFGESNSEAAYTARWIAERSMPKSSGDALLACIAAEEGNLGDFNNPAQGTARHIFRRLYEEGQFQNLKMWAFYEYNSCDRASNSDRQFGSEWIFNAWKNSQSNSDDSQTMEEWISAYANFRQAT
jgi:hypothetical protein